MADTEQEERSLVNGISGGQSPAGGDRWVPERKDAWPQWVSYAQHTEALSWNRFYNFLVFSTILILAWAAIYSGSNHPKYASWVMVSISIVGALSGLVWAGLGYRGRKYVTFYLEQGAKLEEGANAACQVCKQSLEARDKFKFRFVGSYHIHRFAPLAFILLYVLLLVVSVTP